MIKQTPMTHKKRTSTEEPPWTVSRKTTWGGEGVVGLKPVLLPRLFTLHSDPNSNYKYVFGPHRGALPHMRNLRVKHI